MKPRPRRIKRDRLDPATRLALELDLPQAQIAQGDFAVRDVANHSDAEQRHSVRSGNTRTVCRLNRIDKLVKRQVISTREGAACQWYANAHAMRYDTTGITASYGDGGGAPRTNFDHLPKNRAQEQAFWHFDGARAVIPPMIRPMFDRVVLHGAELGKLAITFRTVARRLLEHIESTSGL